MRNTLILGALLLGFAAPENGLTARHAGQQPRRVTVTAHWTAESKDSGRVGYGTESGTLHEKLDATFVVELQEAALPGGQFAKMTGIYTVSFFEGKEVPAGAGKLLSATGTGSYSLESKVLGSCDPTAALGRYSTSKEGSASLGPDGLSFLFQFRGDNVVGVNVGTKPITLSEKSTSLCSPPTRVPPSRTEDHQIGGAFTNIGGEAPKDVWEVQGSRTATGWSGTARSHRQENSEDSQSEVTKTLTYSFDVEGGMPAQEARAPAGQPPPVPPPTPGGGMNMTEYKQGQITFTQGGKEATWPLTRGGVTQMMGMGGGSFTFKPSGGTGSLMLSYQQIGGTPDLTTLSVRGGPAGDAQYNKRQGGCSLRVTQAAAGGVDGSGQCQGGFQGTPITRFAVTVKP